MFQQLKNTNDDIIAVTETGGFVSNEKRISTIITARHKEEPVPPHICTCTLHLCPSISTCICTCPHVPLSVVPSSVPVDRNLIFTANNRLSSL